MRTDLWLKNFPHLLQLYCIAPVWMLWCWHRVELCLKDFPDSPHTWIHSPAWALWCTTNEDLYLNAFPHSLHTKQGIPVWTPWFWTSVCLGLRAFLHSPGVWWLLLCKVDSHWVTVFGFSTVWVVCCCRCPIMVGKSFSNSLQVNGFCNTRNLQLLKNLASSTLLLRVFSPMCSWCCWKFALKQNCFTHAPHLNSFWVCCVSWCSAKWKTFFKTGPQVSQGWIFWEDKAAFGVLACDTPREVICWEGASGFSVPQQQPEQKEMQVKYILTTEKGPAHH